MAVLLAEALDVGHRQPAPATATAAMASSSFSGLTIAAFGFIGAHLLITGVGADPVMEPALPKRASRLHLTTSLTSALRLGRHREGRQAADCGPDGPAAYAWDQ